MSNEPITREEMYLAKLGGADVQPPTPITRKEQFLEKAIQNVGGGSAEGAVLYTEQSLTNEQQARARANIGITTKEVNITDAILYTPQTLTDEQKAQAIKNIGASGMDDLYPKLDISWELGAIDGTTGVGYDASNVARSAEFLDARAVHSIVSSTPIMIFAYNSRYALVGRDASVSTASRTPADIYALGNDVQYIRIRGNWNVYPEELAEKVDVRYIKNTAEIYKVADELKAEQAWKQRQRFNDKPIMVAYSDGAQLGLINTELAYVNAAIAGFRWLKGDVQPTSDGKLVMCHDDGFTFDSDGYITTYNANSANTRAIHDMTYAECMASEYAATYHLYTDYANGSTPVIYRHKVCDLEKFLIVCKEFEVRPYIVIRENYMDAVVPELLRLLKAYDFTENCIVNSFNLESVKQVAEQSNHRVMISRVKSYSKGQALTTAEIDQLLSISPNCTINIYASTDTDEWNNVKLAEASQNAIAYAKSLGVVVGTAMERKPHSLFAKGIGLMQCSTVCIQPKITTITLCVSLLNGVATVERYGTYGARYTADVVVDGKYLYLRNTRLLGSNRDFPDGITPNLADRFPYTLSVVGDNTTGVELGWNNHIAVSFDTKIADLDTTSKKRIFVKFAYGI